MSIETLSDSDLRLLVRHSDAFRDAARAELARRGDEGRQNMASGALPQPTMAVATKGRWDEP